MTPTSTSVDICVGTIVFTDLVGFTEFNDVVGDQEALAVLDQQAAVANEVLGRSNHEARIVKELGDGLMMWFVSAPDAIAAAARFLGSLDRARLGGSFPLSVRLGLHHGEAMERGNDLVGMTVNVAARISDLAGPGELLVSDEAIDAAAHEPPNCVFEPIGPVSVKGVHDPIWLQRLVT
ncbi:MAG: adenylate/guanylate cyclase domain-containing protein [Actinomycetia bacterium]|nr:adenylate/guanylate cyclase domain-containing protein [Actinomycetes bacterium]MCP3910815.1 adenylate/guanylate cyclase domain-containing protein [Actinomycetes bacterium]MCP4087074.1 adenylate/guanylate cyclase domain-containing protein [Actinomycetes bacterium]